MIKLQQKHVDFILDFLKIQEGPNPIETEVSVFKRRRYGMEKQLLGLEIYEDLIPELKSGICDAYQKSLITPGECVGIIGAQSMGEYTTQATLNTFHVAGSNVNTGVSRFQELINASKISKQNILEVYFKDTVTEDRLRQSLTCVRFGDIATPSGHDEDAGHLDFILSLRLVYKYRILQELIKKRLEEDHECECLYQPYETEPHVFTVKTIAASEQSWRERITPSLLKTKLFGIDSVVDWTLESATSATVIGGDIVSLALSELHDLIDFTKISSSNVWEIYSVFGIEAVKHFLIKELREVMSGVNICHIKLLVDRMTFTGTIKPITRYTMRCDEGPLGKASFEESMETFIKAAKYQERDRLTGVSAAVIIGKKPNVGSYSCDLLFEVP